MLSDTKLEMMAYYLINRSIEIYRLTGNSKYLLDYRKVVSLLLMTQCEANNKYGVNLIDKSGRPEAVSQTKQSDDYTLLKLKLMIYESKESGLYVNETFEPELDEFTKMFLDSILYRCVYSNDEAIEQTFKKSSNFEIEKPEYLNNDMLVRFSSL